MLALALAPATAVQPANAGEEAALLIQRPGCVDQHGPRGVWIRSHPAAQAEDDTHDTQGRRLELRRRPDKHHDAPETRRRRRDQEPEEPEKLEPIEDEKVLVSRQPKAHSVTQPENRRSGEEVVQRSLRPVRRRPRGAAQLRRRSADHEPALYDALVATVESHLIDCGACAVAEWPWVNATFSSDGHVRRPRRVRDLLSFISECLVLCSHLHVVLLKAGYNSQRTRERMAMATLIRALSLEVTGLETRETRLETESHTSPRAPRGRARAQRETVWDIIKHLLF